MQNKTMIGAIPSFTLPDMKAIVQSATLPQVTLSSPAPFNLYGQKSAPAPEGYDPNAPKVNPTVLPNGNSTLAPGRDPNAFYSTAPTEPEKTGINFKSPLFLGGAALLAYFLFKK
jgi:hypothetical protein